MALLPETEQKLITDTKHFIMDWNQEFKNFLKNIEGMERRDVGLFFSNNPEKRKKFSTLTWNVHFGGKSFMGVVKNIQPKHIVEILDLENRLWNK